MMNNFLTLVYAVSSTRKTRKMPFSQEFLDSVNSYKLVCLFCLLRNARDAEIVRFLRFNLVEFLPNFHRLLGS